jgi:cell division protein ZapA (FtsZ GTPase activity inhibitor)
MKLEDTLMKQTYTITVADIEMNVISDESAEAVEALVGIVDRKMREIALMSKRCSKAEAALLCALDYCSDKIKAQRKLKALESKLAMTEAAVDDLESENEQLRRELEIYKGIN